MVEESGAVMFSKVDLSSDNVSKVQKPIIRPYEFFLKESDLFSQLDSKLNEIKSAVEKDWSVIEDAKKKSKQAKALSAKLEWLKQKMTRMFALINLSEMYKQRHEEEISMDTVEDIKEKMEYARKVTLLAIEKKQETRDHSLKIDTSNLNTEALKLKKQSEDVIQKIVDISFDLNQIFEKINDSRDLCEKYGAQYFDVLKEIQKMCSVKPEKMDYSVYTQS
jgi:hypothetical protein